MLTFTCMILGFILGFLAGALATFTKCREEAVSGMITFGSAVFLTKRFCPPFDAWGDYLRDEDGAGEC